MIRSATVVTGCLMAAAVWAGSAAADRFEDALGANGPGILVETEKAEPFVQVESGHAYLATDTHDAMVDAVEIDDHLLREGLIHSDLEGPIGPDDPSVTGEIRPRGRVAVKPASMVVPATGELAAATPGPAEANTPRAAGAVVEADEPLLITDRVAEAEAIESAGSWVDRAKSAFSRLLNR